MLLNKLIQKGLIVPTILAIGLTGCTDKNQQAMLQQLQDENELLVAENDGLLEEIRSLNNNIINNQGLSGDKVDGISSVETSSESLGSADGISNKIQFESTLRYPDSYQAPNTSKVQLSDTTTIKPSNNWVISVDGTTTKYTHPIGISGEIKIQKVDSLIDNVFLESELIRPFTDTLDLKVTPYNYKIYVGDNWCGMCSTALINTDYKVIDSQETGEQVTRQRGSAMLKFGSLGYKNTSLVYCFYYDGELDRTKTELIDTLIKSIVIHNQEVRIDS